jgi:hypothetical protein
MLNLPFTNHDHVRDDARSFAALVFAQSAQCSAEVDLACV